MKPKTMKLSEYVSKLVYQKEVNTGYSEGFLKRVQHQPIKTFSTPRNPKFNSGIDSLDLSFDDHLSIKQLIDLASNDVFENISLKYDNHEIITDEIKKMFIKRYWKRRLGCPTVAEWQNNLEYYFEEECKNLLIQNYLLSTLTPNDFLDGGTSTGSNNSDSIQGNKATPDGSTLNITHDKKVLLDRANSVLRAVGEGSSFQSNTISKYDAFIRATTTSNIDTIITGSRKLFMLIN